MASTVDTQATVVRVIQDIVSFKVRSETTNGAYALFETVTPVNAGSPPHRHALEDESFYVLEGEYTFLAGEEVVVLGAGGSIFVPRGMVHAFSNKGDVPARMLIINSPGYLHEGFFSELGEPLDSIPGPPDVARIIAVAEKYQIEIMPPK
jgi:uncharacterized cupin superfamily protein